MGKIGQFITGGSRQKSTSQSSNKAYDTMANTYGGQMNQGTQAGGMMSALLGVGGDKAASDEAFKNYNDSTGYKFMMDSGSEAITGNAAAKGLLNSGSTLKSLTSFGQNLGKTQFGSYLDRLMGVSENGMKGAGLMASTGNISSSKSNGSSKPGIAKFLGAIMSGGAGG